jgi:hypothetical protein
VLVSDNEARCIIQGELTAGPATLTLSTPFHNVSTTTNPNIKLVGVCPCGLYAIEGSKCVPCPPHAICNGAREPPRAAAGHFDCAGPSEGELSWAGLPPFSPLFPRERCAFFQKNRSMAESTTIHMAEFPLCPIPEVCHANMRCEEGTAGYMCVNCSNPSWQRDFDGKCRECGDVNKLATRVSVGIVFAIAFLLSIAECTGLRRAARPWLRRATQCGRVRAVGLAAPPDDRRGASGAR